jgi:hypothetical protein
MGEKTRNKREKKKREMLMTRDSDSQTFNRLGWILDGK